MERRNRESVSAWFGKLSGKSARVVGSPLAFAIAVISLILWAASGPVFHYSDTWQLVINTVTTIITFLIVFLIQNTQNRDARAIHLKLDEVIRSIRAAHNEMIDIEDLSDEQLEQIASRYEDLKNSEDRRQHKGSARVNKVHKP